MKITEALEILRKSYEDVKNVKGYRLGQAILNNIDDPEEYDKYKDLFYIEDERKVRCQFLSKTEDYQQ